MDAAQTAILVRILTKASKAGASDLHFNAGFPPVMRVGGKLAPMTDEDVMNGGSIGALVMVLFNDQQRATLEAQRAVRGTYEFEGKLRVTVGAYYQEGQLSLSMRFIEVHVKSLRELGVPASIEQLAMMSHGLLIVGGTQGSGRTTLAAAILEHINRTGAQHIVTLESPIEYNLVGNHSLIDQREVGSDVVDFLTGLSQVGQEDVDVLLLGQFHEPTVIKRAIELALSGILVVAVMETDSSVHALEKIVSMYPEHEQGYVRNLLADGLVGIVIQALAPRVGGGMIGVHEILINTPTVKTLILTGRTAQIPTTIRTAKAEGMAVLDHQLVNLVRNQEVTLESARAVAQDRATFETLVRG